MNNFRIYNRVKRGQSKQDKLYTKPDKITIKPEKYNLSTTVIQLLYNCCTAVVLLLYLCFFLFESHDVIMDI